MISVELARDKVLAGLQPVGTEVVPLSQSLGRVLADHLVARVSHPPVAVSAMDGWAVRAADVATVPATLKIVGESAAGHPFGGSCGPDGAVRIFTGAPIPHGADAVVMQERAHLAPDGFVVIEESVPAGKFIRPAGLDFKVDDVLLPANTVMGARAIGLAAAMNVPWLTVRRRPRVAVLSTGDEIALPGDPLGPASLPGSNGPALCAFVTAAGAEAVHLGIARDSRVSLQTMLAGFGGCDLVVTTGGASVGDYDLVKDALADAGLTLDFYKIAMRPGKPLMFGHLKGVPVLGLPGNPVSALVCAVMFLEPMLKRLLGLPSETPTATAALGRDLPANDERQDYLRASLERRPDGTLVATPFAVQDSAVLSGMAAADCLAVRPPHAHAAKAGEPVQVIVLPAGG
ncbi:MAG: gephyrin-like molybdotransferase Glp [Actinomycetota bacterium]